MPLPAILAQAGKAAVQAAVAAARAAASAAVSGAQAAGSLGAGAARAAASGAKLTGNAIAQGSKFVVNNTQNIAGAAKNMATGFGKGVYANSSGPAQSVADNIKNIMGNLSGLLKSAIGSGRNQQQPPPVPPPPVPPPGPGPNPPPPQPQPGPGLGPGVSGLTAGRDIQDLVKNLIMLPKKVKDFGESLTEGRRGLMDYSGSISMAVAKLDADRVQRNIALANNTGGSAKYQSEAHSRLEQALAPGFERMTNLLNRLTGFAENGIANVVETLNSSFGPILKFLERRGWIDPAKPPSKPNEMPLNSLLNQIAAGKVFERNNPPIHKRPKGWEGPK